MSSTLGLIVKKLHSLGHDTGVAVLQLISFKFLGPTGKGFIFLQLLNVHFCMFVFPQIVCIASSNVFYITWKNRKALMERKKFHLIASATRWCHDFSSKVIPFILELGDWTLHSLIVLCATTLVYTQQTMGQRDIFLLITDKENCMSFICKYLSNAYKKVISLFLEWVNIFFLGHILAMLFLT